MVLRYLIPCLLLCCSLLPADAVGQCESPELFPSILVGEKTCDSLTLTAINAEDSEISWLVDGMPIPGGTSEVLHYVGETNERTFTLEIRSNGQCGSDSELIIVGGSCPREVCGNGIDDDGDGLVDLQDTEDCSCGDIPERKEASLIPNGSFERRRTGNPECDGCYHAYWQLDCVQGWEAGNAGSSIEHVLKCYANGIGSAFINYTLGNNASFLAARIAYDSTGFSTQETARVELISPTVPGARYQFSLLIDVASGSIKDIGRPTQEFILFGAGQHANFPFRFQGKAAVESGGNWEDWTEIDSFSIEINTLRSWQYVAFEFIAPAEPITHLVLAGKLTTNYVFPSIIDGYNAYYVMDNVALERILPPLTLPEELEAAITVTPQPVDEGDPCLRNKLLTTPPQADYAYQWYLNDAGIPGATQNQYLVDALGATSDSYRVGVYKDGVCRLSDRVQLEEAVPFRAMITTDSVSCHGRADGRIDVLTDPPGIVEHYRIINTAGPENEERILDASGTITGLTAGTHTLILTDTAGCALSRTLEIAEPAPLTAQSVVVETDCGKGPAGQLSLQAEGGTTPYFVHLNNEPAMPLVGPLFLTPGTYRVVVSDAAECRIEILDVVIPAIEPFLLDAVSSHLTISLGESVTLSYTSNRTLLDAAFAWEGVPDTLCQSCPQLRVRPTATTRFALSVTDTDGCSQTDSVNVRVIRTSRVYFPSAITPNADGINDTFRAFPGASVRLVSELQIFDRWGAMVYSGQGADAEWDGGQAAAGVYVFSARLLLLDGSTETRTGSFTLIR